MNNLFKLFFIISILYTSNNLNASDNFNFEKSFQEYMKKQESIRNSIHDIVWNDEKFDANKAKIFTTIIERQMTNAIIGHINDFNDSENIYEAEKTDRINGMYDIESDLLEGEYYLIEIISRMIRDNKFKNSILNNFESEEEDIQDELRIYLDEFYEKYDVELSELEDNSIDHESEQSLLYGLSTKLGYDKNKDDLKQYVGKIAKLYKELQ